MSWAEQAASALGEATPYELAVTVPYCVALVAVAAEVVWRVVAGPGRRQHLLTSAGSATGMAAGALVVGVAYTAALVPLWHLVSRLAPAGLPAWWAAHPVTGFVAAFVAWDLAAWAYHLIGHGTAVGWAAHQPHHTGDDYDLTLGLRQSWVPVHGLAVHPLVALAGFDLRVVFACAALSNGWQFLVHTSVAVPVPHWLSSVVVTPDVHRHHHGRDAGATNLGAVFTVWDRLAGTWSPPDRPAPTVWGQPTSSANPVRIQLAGWAQLWSRRRSPRQQASPVRLGVGRWPSSTVDPMTAPDLQDAAAAIEAASAVIRAATRHLAETSSVDADQVLAYDVAHAAAAVETGRSMLDYGAKGELEAKLTCVFVADAVADLGSKLWGREAQWDIAPDALDAARSFVAAWRDPAVLAELAFQDGPRHLDPEFELVQDTFRRFAEERIMPVAEHIHRHNDDIPEALIQGLAEMGVFGLSIPEQYGGFAGGGESDYYGMVIATEELSRASLGAGGSLITRPEILARALEAGGTEEQKATWLPRLAMGEIMNAVAVTEPDYGSDVAGIKVTATPATDTDGTEGWRINGVKTWCTFGARADVLMLLARTDPDRSKGHRGLSVFIVPKQRGEAHGFVHTQDGGGRMEARPIDTIGYRGMHSYEIAFEDWFVPAENLIGMESGQGRGFYFQMAGFENGRLQTAARALGVMQAAYEAAKAYASDRVVFGHPIADYQLTRAKLTRMAALIQGGRQFSYSVGRMMAKGEGAMEASMVKAYVCKAAEWVTREAMQIHGGMGYAEEYPVSRYFVDARVLSIFEGADETLCLKVIARKLVGDAAANAEAPASGG